VFGRGGHKRFRVNDVSIPAYRALQSRRKRVYASVLRIREDFQPLVRSFLCFFYCFIVKNNILFNTILIFMNTDKFFLIYSNLNFELK
jgi:hypothetical protein